MWEYIRLKVRNAVLQGVNDAMTEMHNSEAHEAEVVVTLHLAAPPLSSQAHEKRI
jgi:hypothetical protein